MLVIHAHVYNPADPSLFGKGKKSEPAEYHTVTCSTPERCDLFASGQCILRRFGPSCPHGRKHVVRGPSGRAKGFDDWISVHRTEANRIGALDRPPDKIARVGDDLYLPYSVLAPVLRGESCDHYLNASPLVGLGLFTADRIAAACDFEPRGIFGGVIHDYQREAIPRLVAHLSEDYPDLLAAAAPLSARIRAIQATLTKVGRKARLHTLKPNVGTFEGYTWDGVHMRTTTRKTMPPFSPFQPVEMLIVPAADAVVVVTDDAQVTPETAWVD
jgi:hypothetical protein